MVHSPNDDTHFFDVVVGDLKGNTFAPYMFIIYLDYILWTSIDLIKKNGFPLKKTSSRWYPAETMTDVHYTDDFSLLTNTLAQAKLLLHSLN